MKNRLFELTETYTLPILMAIVTVAGIVQPWVSPEVVQALRAFIGL